MSLTSRQLALGPMALNKVGIATDTVGTEPPTPANSAMRAVAVALALVCAFVGGVGSHAQTEDGRRGALVFVILAAVFGVVACRL